MEVDCQHNDVNMSTATSEPIRVGWEFENFPQDCQPPEFRTCSGHIAIVRFLFFVKSVWPFRNIQYVYVNDRNGYCNRTIIDAIGQGFLHTRVHLFPMTPVNYQKVFFTQPLLITRVSIYYANSRTNILDFDALIDGVFNPFKPIIWVGYLIVTTMKIFAVDLRTTASRALKSFILLTNVLNVYDRGFEVMYGTNSAAAAIIPSKPQKLFRTFDEVIQAVENTQSHRLTANRANNIRFLIRSLRTDARHPTRQRLAASLASLMDPQRQKEIDIRPQTAHIQMCRRLLAAAPSGSLLLAMWDVDMIDECRHLDGYPRIQKSEISSVLMTNVFGGIALPKSYAAPEHADAFNIGGLSTIRYMDHYRRLTKPLFRFKGAPPVISSHNVFGAVLTWSMFMGLAFLAFILESKLPPFLIRNLSTHIFFHSIRNSLNSF